MKVPNREDFEELSEWEEELDNYSTAMEYAYDASIEDALVDEEDKDYE